jgi:short subunit dehydrogenase-like uncharacterized protein
MKIAVYGAYGYQGKLVVTELSRRGIDLVLVGRDPARLRSIGAPDADRRVAAADDHNRLVAAFRGTNAVINCAGPFTVCGMPVIRAAVAAGCHYVDTSGEQLYLKQVFDTFATDAGITIVPGANDDCLPSDLIAALAAARLATVEQVSIAVDLAGGASSPSRGTLRSVLASLETFTSGGEVYDRGQWRADTPARCTSMVFPGSPQPARTVKFALPGVVTVPRHVSANWVEGVARAELVDAFGSVTPELINQLPEGPTAEHRRTAKFVVVVDVASTDGRSARGIVEGTDPYGTTAVIAVEAARRLAADSPKPGVLTPAQAYDPADFLNFLNPHGVTWTVHETSGSWNVTPRRSGTGRLC